MVFALLLLIIIPPAYLPGADGTDTRPVRFGHAYGENSAVIFNKFAPLIHLLSGELDRKVVFVLTNTYEEMQLGYLNQEIDMGIINAYSYIKIMDSPFLVPVAARVKENDKNYRSLFIARKDSGIKTIEDLKGKSFAFGDPYSTSSFLVPLYHLDKMGIVPERFFSKTVTIPKQDSIIYSILNRTVDCGALASFIFNEQEESLKERFGIIFESNPFPLGPFVVNSSLGKETVEKTRKFLLNLANTEEGRRALAQADLDPFMDVKKSDYDWLRVIADSGYTLDASIE